MVESPGATSTMSEQLARPALFAPGARSWLAGSGPYALLALTILAFSHAWQEGRLVLDGPGVALYLRVALNQWRHTGRIPYWQPQFFSGTPAFALAPSAPTLALLPLARLVGADRAVQVASLALQIIGAWGAFVLARSLWRSVPAALVAGLAYGLSPVVIEYAALYGQETSLGVLALTPWLAWSVRRAFRGNGARYVVLSGLVAALAILQQAEHAYALVVMCGCLLVVRLAEVRHISASPRSEMKAVGARALALVAVILGTLAYWLFPLVALHGRFLATIWVDVPTALHNGLGGLLAAEPGASMTRTGALHGAVGISYNVLSSGAFYLGGASLALTAVSLVLLTRQDDDGTFPALLLASSFCLWTSTAALPLARSGLAARSEVLPFLVIGLLAGLTLVVFIQRLHLGRWERPAMVAGVAVALAVPYVTPFLILRAVAPFASLLDFPRLYPLAAVGLALGTAYPVTLVAPVITRRVTQESSAERALPILGASVVALLIAGVFVIDVLPYTSYYRVHQPDRSVAYGPFLTSLAADHRDIRIASANWGDPQVDATLAASGRPLAVGWPFPVSSEDAYRLTERPLLGPSGYLLHALALSATAYITGEDLLHPAATNVAVSGLHVTNNPYVLSMVRAYDRAVLVGDPAAGSRDWPSPWRRNTSGPSPAVRPQGTSWARSWRVL